MGSLYRQFVAKIHWGNLIFVNVILLNNGLTPGQLIFFLFLTIIGVINYQLATLTRLISMWRLMSYRTVIDNHCSPEPCSRSSDNWKFYIEHPNFREERAWIGPGFDSSYRSNTNQCVLGLLIRIPIWRIRISLLIPFRIVFHESGFGSRSEPT